LDSAKAIAEEFAHPFWLVNGGQRSSASKPPRRSAVTISKCRPVSLRVHPAHNNLQLTPNSHRGVEVSPGALLSLLAVSRM